MDVIPDAKLPEPSQPWGRHLTQLSSDNAIAVERLGQDTANNMKQLNGNVGLLSQQVSDLNDIVTKLSSFTTQTATGNGGVTTALGTTVWSSTGATINSNYTRSSSVVQLTATAAWNGLATILTSGVAQSLGRLSLLVDGGIVAQPVSYVYTNNGSANTIGGSAYLSATYTIALPAGAHTFTAYGEGFIAGSSGQTQVSGISLIASVIG